MVSCTTNFQIQEYGTQSLEYISMKGSATYCLTLYTKIKLMGIGDSITILKKLIQRIQIQKSN